MLEQSQCRRFREVRTQSLLLAYFSLSGNTKRVADSLARRLEVERFEIEPVRAYPTSFALLQGQALRENSQHSFPELQCYLEDLSSCRALYLGFPNWIQNLPRPVFSFLQAHREVRGLQVYPFCTHGGGGIGRSIKELNLLLPEAIIAKPLVIRDKEVENSEAAIDTWLAQCMA